MGEVMTRLIVCAVLLAATTFVWAVVIVPNIP